MKTIGNLLSNEGINAATVLTLAGDARRADGKGRRLSIVQGDGIGDAVEPGAPQHEMSGDKRRSVIH